MNTSVPDVFIYKDLSRHTVPVKGCPCSPDSDSVRLLSLHPSMS